jgi:hypothetical protein
MFVKDCSVKDTGSKTRQREKLSHDAVATLGSDEVGMTLHDCLNLREGVGAIIECRLPFCLGQNNSFVPMRDSTMSCQLANTPSTQGNLQTSALQGGSGHNTPTRLN